MRRMWKCGSALLVGAFALLMARVALTQSIGFERVREAASGEIAAGRMPGVAVAIVHKGRVVFAEGFGIASTETKEAVTSDTVFQVGSAGKMLTAAAVLETAADGRLAIDEPIARRVRGLDATIGALTPHQLLAQTSGMRDMPGAYGELSDDAHGRFLRTLTARDRILAPGQSFSYSNIGYSLAGLAAAEASGVPFGALMAQRVFEPIGMRRTTVQPMEAMTRPLAVGHTKQPDGSFRVVRPMAHDTRLWPAGYVFTTANDLARFAIALLDEGRIDGHQVLRPETPRQMLTAHVDLPGTFEGWRYGYGLFLMPMRGLEAAEHAGSMVGFAALVRTVPAHEFAVVALSNAEAPAVRTVDAAMEALLPTRPATPPAADGPPLPMAESEMKRYVGRYENRGHFVIAVEEGALVLRQNDGLPLSMRKVGVDRFIATGPGGQPRLRIVLRPPAEDRPATLHFSLWAYPNVTTTGQ